MSRLHLRILLGTFADPGLSCDGRRTEACLLAAVVPGEADRAQELYVHEQEEDETGDELLSDDEVDDPVAITE
jgi:hypothetical protein